MIVQDYKFQTRRPAKQVLVDSLARAAERDNRIEYFLGAESPISPNALYAWSTDDTLPGPGALIRIKYLGPAMRGDAAKLQKYFYIAVSDYWRDHGIEYPSTRLPYPFRLDMTCLAIAENIDPMTLICADCYGSGRLDEKIGCKKCQGSGRVIFTDDDRAGALALTPAGFARTWREFYQAIQLILKAWDAGALDACQ